MNLDDFKHASNFFKRLNPDLGGLCASFAQRCQAPALVGESARAKKGARIVGARNGPLLRVTIISLRNRTRDGDNEQGGLKELRDAIADWCGLDDADNIISWQYGQIQTRGRQGTIVKIEICG